MATKKVNVRKDYSYATKKSPPKYKAGLPRKPFFLILSGPGLDFTKMVEDEKAMKLFGDKKRIKLKFVRTKSEAELVTHIKDGNTWATGIVVNLGELNDETGIIDRTIKKILISTVEVRDDASYEDALQILIKEAQEEAALLAKGKTKKE